MSRDPILYNSEGYKDPTAGAALAHIIHEERVQRRKLRENGTLSKTTNTSEVMPMTETAKTAKRFLGEAYWTDTRIDAKLRQVQNLRAMATRVTQQFGGEVVSHSRVPCGMEDNIVKIVLLEKEIDREVDRLVDIRKRIKEIITAVPDRTEQLILELRYESFCTWAEIETMIRLSRSKMFLRHAHALETVYVLMGEKGMLDG